MQSGFRAAQAFVEVSAKLDDEKVLAAARRAASGMDATLREGGERAGRGMTKALERAGSDSGIALVGSMEKRLRDSQGRLRGAGVKISEDVRKGAADDFDRPGWSVFAGLIKKAPKAGAEMASGLAGALGQGLSGPAAPYLIGGLSLAAVTAGPVVGGVLAGGILAGLATGVIAGGVAAQLQDPEIKHAATTTGGEISDILMRATTPFKAPLLTAIDQGGKAFQRWEPTLHEISSIASTMLNPLINGVIRMVDQILPKLPAGLNAAELPIQAIADGLSGMGEAVGDVIGMLSDNGPEAALALHAAFFLINGSVRNIGMAINVMTEGLGMAVDSAFWIAAWMVKIGEAAQYIPGPLGGIGKQLLDMGGSLEGSKVKWDQMRDAAKNGTTEAAAGTKALDDRTKFLALSMGAAVQQAGSLSAAFKLLNGGALSAREAESAYQAAIDGVTASIKANGKTLDLHTEKGRANDQAIRALIQSTDQKAQATYDETSATKGAAAAEQAALGVYEAGRRQLVKNLTQLLGNAGAANKMADEIMGIPKSWNSNVKVQDNATAKAKAIQYEINKIHGKTVVVAIKYETHGNAPGEHIIGQGTQLKDRWGGVHEPGLTRARDGVVRDADMFGPRSPGRYLIAEPETGGELFAPKHGNLARTKAMVSYAIENWWGGWEGFAPKATGGPSPAPAASGGGARSAGGDGGATFVFQPGSVVLDASKIQSLEDLLRMLQNLVPTARSYRLGSVG
jgi:hypothetical protein